MKPRYIPKSNFGRRVPGDWKPSRKAKRDAMFAAFMENVAVSWAKALERAFEQAFGTPGLYQLTEQKYQVEPQNRPWSEVEAEIVEMRISATEFCKTLNDVVGQ